MKYVIYLRVSTEEQKKSGLGLDVQRNACVEYAQKNGNWPYVIFSDEGVSGGLKMEDRDEMDKAFQALEPGDVFLVSSRDRLGRDVINNAIIEREIKKKKAKLVVVNQNDSDMDEGMAQLMKTVVDAFAQYERYLISKRTKAALSRKKAKGERLGHVPYGFKLNEAKQIEVCMDEAEILRRMYHYRMNGLTFRDIATKLNKDGYRNRSTKKRQEVLWTHGATSRVYQNYAHVSATGHRKNQER